MAIRSVGLVSGMDTETIVEELVKAKSTKKETLEKDQKKLSWKQDAWKELNSKIYKLYSGTLSNLRLKSDYAKKTTKASNDAVSIITGVNAPEAVQTLHVTNMAKAAYLTGAKLSITGGVKASDNVAEKFGIEVGTKFSITAGKDGEAKEIEITEDMTVDKLVGKIREAGVNCNFDEKNQRFYVNASKTGLDSNFSITASDSAGVAALSKFGLLTDDAYDRDTVINAAIEDKKREFKGKLNEASDALAAATDAATAAQSAYDTAVTDYMTAYGDDAEVDPDVIQTSIDTIQAQIDALDPEADADEITILQAQIDTLMAQKTASENLISLNDANNAAQSALTTAQTAYDDAVAAYDWENDPTVLASLEADVTADMDDILDGYDAGAKFIGGANASIELNEVVYTSDSNTFEINGLTISLNHEYDEDITLTTSQDTAGIYDMIKGFLKEYNELINEMDKLYNAESASKFQMLSDEEKDAMNEDDIKEWEDKIKSALLRKDNTLGNVSNAMKTIMLQGVKMSDGKMMYLSQFGINTLGYFGAKDNERNAYHIDGDPDDEAKKTEPDKLNALIASDPDMVAEFFSNLSKTLYDKLGELMERTDFSSAFTVYNDKQLQSDYDDYTDKIKKQEEKVNKWEDYYYDKFTRMETAMAKLQSKTDAVSQMFSM